MTMEGKLTGSVSFQMNGSTGTTARIIRELTETGSDPRAWFEPAERGGWVYTHDFSFVTSTEREAIIAGCKDG